jgi:tRNA A-37 threonylcarbamoyl transferase component Bud32
MEILDVVMKWIVAPVAAFVLLLHSKTQNHATDIAVLKATQQANKEAHDREFKEMRSSFKAVLDKLESIEQHLRK